VATGLILVLGALVAGWRRRTGATSLLILLLVLGAVAPAQASVLYMSDNAMANVADVIVDGVVTSAEPRQAGPGRPISTHVTLELMDSIKGRLNKSSSINLVVPGGRIGNQVTVATEGAQFTQGERVLLYLEYDQDTGYQIIGGHQGKLSVLRSAKDGELYVLDAKKRAGIRTTEKSATGGVVPLQRYKDGLKESLKEQAKSSKHN